MAEWDAALRDELDILKKQRNEIDAHLQRVSKKLDLLRQMRSLEEPSAAAAPQGAALIAASDSRPTPANVREMTKKILAELGRPLHISEIHRQFTGRGYPIPGSGTPFNILAHLVNSKDFVRVARGTYALSGSVPPEQVLPRVTRKRRRARRRKRRAAQRDQEIQ